MSIYVKLKTLFDDTPSEVDTGKRFLGYLIDWFLGALFMMLPLCLLWMFQTQDMESMRYLDLWLIEDRFSRSQAIVSGCLGLLAALFYYVYIPWRIFPGQTIGKRAVGIKIISIDNMSAGFKVLMVRQVIGIMILEGTLYNVSGLIRVLLSMITGLNFTGILLYQGLVTSILSVLMAMFFQSHRMLHDYLAKTKVVLCSKEGK